MLNQAGQHTTYDFTPQTLFLQHFYLIKDSTPFILRLKRAVYNRAFFKKVKYFHSPLPANLIIKKRLTLILRLKIIFRGIQLLLDEVKIVCKFLTLGIRFPLTLKF